MEPRYPIRSAAKIVGLSIDVLRAWERRYRAVVPERGHRGREYSAEQVERLILLRQLIDRGHAIGAIAALDEVALARLLDVPAAKRESALARNLLDPIFEALDNFQQSRAGQELSRLATLLSPRALVYEVVLPLMHEVGERWHNGTLMIAQEHMASAMVRNLLGGLVRLNQAPDESKKILLSTPAGELHEFGALAAAMIVAVARLDPIYLGPDLPAAELIEAARRSDARVVVIAITTVSGEIIREINALEIGLPKHVELWIGGDGVDGLDAASTEGRAVFMKDFDMFERACRRLGGRV